MSDSPRFPQSPRFFETPPADNAGRGQKSEKVHGRLIQLPENLKILSRDTTLRGEVIAEVRDAQGRVELLDVRTPEGDIRIRVNATDTPVQERHSKQQPPVPKTGESVSIEIEAGSPPKAASVQVEAEGAGQKRVNVPRIKSAETASSPSRTSTTPVDIYISTPQAGVVKSDQGSVEATGVQKANVSKSVTSSEVSPNEKITSLPSLPDVGSIVRLTLASKAEIANVITQSAQNVTLTTLSEGIYSSPVSAQIPVNIMSVLSANAENVGAQTLDVKSLSNGENIKEIPVTKAVSPRSSEQISLAAVLSDMGAEPNIALTYDPFSAPSPLPLKSSPAQVTESFKAPDFLDARISALRLPLPISVAPNIGVDSESEALFLQNQKEFSDTWRISPFSDGNSTANFQIQGNEKAFDASLLLSDAQAGSSRAVITGVVTQMGGLPLTSVYFAEMAQGEVYALQVPADHPEALARGTTLILTPQSSSSGVTSQVVPLPLPLFLSPSPSWDTLDQAMQVLNTIVPNVAQSVSTMVPNAASPAQLTPAALVFLAVMRGGDLSGWLGDKAMDAIRRGGRSGLLERLTHDSNHLSRLGSDPVSGEWRAMALPLAYNQDIQKLALYYKHERESDAESEHGKVKTTRFVFDINMDAMGKVQLDGLYRPAESVKRLDLILRTQSAFSEAVRQDMRKTYAGALSETMLTGELSFQTDPAKWVNIDVQDKLYGAEA